MARPHALRQPALGKPLGEVVSFFAHATTPAGLLQDLPYDREGLRRVAQPTSALSVEAPHDRGVPDRLGVGIGKRRAVGFGPRKFKRHPLCTSRYKALGADGKRCGLSAVLEE